MQEILINTGLQLTPDQEKQLLSACEHPLIAGCSPPSAFISEPFATAPALEAAPHSAAGPPTLSGLPSRGSRVSMFAAGVQQPAGPQAFAGTASRSHRVSVFAPGAQHTAGAPAFAGAASRSQRTSVYSPGGPALLAPAPERPYQRAPSAPRRAHRASVAPGATGGFLALARTTSTAAPPPAPPQEASAPIASDSDRTSSNESAGSIGAAPPPGRSSVTWGGARASPGLGLASGFGPALPVEPPRVALSLPHLLLAPVLEAALIARRAARLARLRSSGGAELCHCPTCVHLCCHASGTSPSTASLHAALKLWSYDSYNT